MNKKTFAFLFITLSALLVGCFQQTKQPEVIAASLEIRYQDTSEISFGTPINVWVKNTSNYCIEFPLKGEVKAVYAQQKEKWVEIPNLVKRAGNQNLVIKPKGDLFSERMVLISPDVSSLSIDGPTKFYALLAGYLCDDHNIQIQKEIPFTIVP